MAPSPIATDSPEEAARVRAENEQLRAQNLRLRAAVCAARPETPEQPMPPTPVAGGALGAADRLVHLMQEGGHLLKEREALRAENEALESELQSIVGEDVAAEAAGGDAEVPVVEAANGVDEEEDSTLVDRLVPLLSEGDALRTERQALRAERQELMNELGAVGSDEAEEAEDIPAGDQELESRFLAAVEEASRENASLEAEIKKLREENSRLKTKSVSAAKAEAEAVKDVNTDSYKIVEPAKPAAVSKPAVVSKPFKSPLKNYGKVPNPIKASPPAEEEVSYQQREAMAALLRKSQGVVSPSTARSGIAGRGFSIEKGKKELDQGQEAQLKGALHTLFRNFGK